jgi:hypothetical protein
MPIVDPDAQANMDAMEDHIFEIIRLTHRETHRPGMATMDMLHVYGDHAISDTLDRFLRLAAARLAHRLDLYMDELCQSYSPLGS